LLMCFRAEMEEAVSQSCFTSVERHIPTYDDEMSG
jgi:hypothetical protein